MATSNITNATAVGTIRAGISQRRPQDCSLNCKGNVAVLAYNVHFIELPVYSAANIAQFALQQLSVSNPTPAKQTLGPDSTTTPVAPSSCTTRSYLLASFQTSSTAHHRVEASSPPSAPSSPPALNSRVVQLNGDEHFGYERRKFSIRTTSQQCCSEAVTSPWSGRAARAVV